MENRRLQEGGGASGPPADSAHGPADGELLRLQAENAALHKKLRGESDGKVLEVRSGPDQAGSFWFGPVRSVSDICFSRSSSPAALQERFDGELQRPPVAHGDQSVATETDGPAGTNGVSDVAGGGARAGPEGTNQRVSTCSKAGLDHRVLFSPTRF